MTLTTKLFYLHHKRGDGGYIRIRPRWYGIAWVHPEKALFSVRMGYVKSWMVFGYLWYKLTPYKGCK